MLIANINTMRVEVAKCSNTIQYSACCKYNAYGDYGHYLHDAFAYGHDQDDALLASMGLTSTASSVINTRISKKLASTEETRPELSDTQSL